MRERVPWLRVEERVWSIVDGTWKVVESTLDPKFAIPSSDQQGNNNYSKHLHSVCFDRKSCVKIVFHVGDFFLISFKVATKHKKMILFYRKYILKNCSFSRKHYHWNKQSINWGFSAKSIYAFTYIKKIYEVY